MRLSPLIDPALKRFQYDKAKCESFLGRLLGFVFVWFRGGAVGLLNERIVFGIPLLARGPRAAFVFPNRL